MDFTVLQEKLMWENLPYGVPNLSVAFDIVDNSILLDRLSGVGIGGLAFS